VGQFWEGTWFESKSGHPPSWLRMFMTLLSTSRQVVFWYLYWGTEASFQILSYSPFHPLIPYRLKYLYRLKRNAGVLFELTVFRSSSALELDVSRVWWSQDAGHQSPCDATAYLRRTKVHRRLLRTVCNDRDSKSACERATARRLMSVCLFCLARIRREGSTIVKFLKQE
jgi:hypothetical protein